MVFNDPTCFNALCGNLSLEELFHQRMVHVPIPKLAKMSLLVDGLQSHLHFPKELRVPCALCYEAKAKRQPFPDASETVYENEDDLMTWDLIDVGEDWTSIGGFHYISVFIVKRSQYAITILHKDRADFVGVLCKAIAKAGFTQKRICCDGAGEYVSGKLAEFLDANNILPQFSNPFEQHGNGLSETFVDSIGKGIPAHYWTDVYNHVPHSFIGDQIPFTVHHWLRPDVPWFSSFGCLSTVFCGRDLIDSDHHKLAPRGERGILVGLGMSHDSKCWLVYAPRLNSIFASQNVTFNNTLYPLKDCDQLVYGYYDN
eukprot:2154229-Rhodomonas_salina.8